MEIEEDEKVVQELSQRIDQTNLDNRIANQNSIAEQN